MLQLITTESEGLNEGPTSFGGTWEEEDTG